jgi:hypothetical protein
MVFLCAKKAFVRPKKGVFRTSSKLLRIASIIVSAAACRHCINCIALLFESSSSVYPEPVLANDRISKETAQKRVLVCYSTFASPPNAAST